MYIKIYLLTVVVVVAVLAFAECKPAVSNDGNNLPPAVICKLPPVRGHCRALLPRWRYDSATKQCHEFKFGGCDGNGNNFLTHKACMATCGGI